MKKVLVVDDEFAIADVLSALLSDEGYHVTTAYSAREALSLLSESPPDLLILDLMMPSMSGLAMLARLRATAELARLPVILMSAPHETDLPLPDGVEVVPKPFTLMRILLAIHGLIGTPPRG